jgi:hypothetical protein
MVMEARTAAARNMLQTLASAAQSLDIMIKKDIIS